MRHKAMQIPLLSEILAGFQVLRQPQKPDDFNSGVKAGLAIGVTLGAVALITTLIVSLWLNAQPITESEAYDYPAQLDG